MVEISVALLLGAVMALVLTLSGVRRQTERGSRDEEIERLKEEVIRAARKRDRALYWLDKAVRETEPAPMRRNMLNAWEILGDKGDPLK